MLGQAHHFNRKAPASEFYGRDRYNSEAQRLYGVLERQLSTHEHICGDYGIADMIVLPSVRRSSWEMVNLAAFPHVQRWHCRLIARPAVIRAYGLPEAEI